MQVISRLTGAVPGFIRGVVSLRALTLAAAVVGAGMLATDAQAGRRDQAGSAQVRQANKAVKRIQAIQKSVVRTIERTPAATIRQLEVLGARGATPQALEAIALRGMQKVALAHRRGQDQLQRYTNGIPQFRSLFVSGDGEQFNRGIEDLDQGVVAQLRLRSVSDELIMQVVQSQQEAVAAIQDAALIAQAEIEAAIADALAP